MPLLSEVSGARLVRSNLINRERDDLGCRIGAFQSGNVNGPRFDELKDLIERFAAWVERAREFYTIVVPQIDVEDRSHSEILQALTECIESAR